MYKAPHPFGYIFVFFITIIKMWLFSCFTLRGLSLRPDSPSRMIGRYPLSLPATAESSRSHSWILIRCTTLDCGYCLWRNQELFHSRRPSGLMVSFRGQHLESNGGGGGGHYSQPWLSPTRISQIFTYIKLA